MNSQDNLVQILNNHEIYIQNLVKFTYLLSLLILPFLLILKFQLFSKTIDSFKIILRLYNSGYRFNLNTRHEWWVGFLAGSVNGILTGMTGSFVVPGVFYLQSIGLHRDALIQSMGILFTTSTLALFHRIEIVLSLGEKL